MLLQWRRLNATDVAACCNNQHSMNSCNKMRAIQTYTCVIPSMVPSDMYHRSIELHTDFMPNRVLVLGYG